MNTFHLLMFGTAPLPFCLEMVQLHCHDYGVIDYRVCYGDSTYVERHDIAGDDSCIISQWENTRYCARQHTRFNPRCPSVCRFLSQSLLLFG